MMPCAPTMFLYRRRQPCDAPCFVHSSWTPQKNSSCCSGFWLPLLLFAIFPRPFLILGKLVISAFILLIALPDLLRSSASASSSSCRQHGGLPVVRQP